MIKGIFIAFILLLNGLICTLITLPVVVSDYIETEYNNDNINYIQHPLLPLRQTSCLDISFHPHSNNHLYVPAKIGNPPQAINLRLSTKDQYIWVTNEDGFNLTRSSSGKNSSEIMMLDLINHNGVITIDDISIGDAIIKDFSFLVIYERVSFFDVGNLGLGKTEKKNRHLNLIDTLYDKHLITKKAFYLKIIDNQHSLSIGEYPREVEINENKKYFHLHKLIHPKTPNDLYKISTYLNAVFIEGESKIWEINDIVSFSYGSNYISVSFDFFDYLKNNFFKPELDSEVCFLHEKRNYEYFQCSTKRFGSKEAINFVLGDWTYKFKHNEYLLRVNEKDNRMVAFVKNTKFDGWVFGYHFYLKYLTVFDIQEDKIGIYYHP